MRLRLEIPRIAPSLNIFVRLHWAKKRNLKRIWVQEIKAARGANRKVFKRCKITYTRQSIKELDIDNLASSFKVPLDALVEAGIIPDDNPMVVAEIVFQQIKVANKVDVGTIIEIKEIEIK